MHLKVFGCEGFSFFRRKSMGWRLRIDHALSCRGRLASLAVGLTVALAGVATSLPAGAQLTSPKTTGISTTKHNLGSGSSFGNKSSGVGATTEICVFCHTPHAANVAAGPLWNRIAGTATYVPYTSASLTGGTRDTTTGMGIAESPGSISLACLSCHDGTQALNSVINAPGSGGYNAAGATFGSFTGNANVSGVAAVGAGTEGLSNDHPIGVRYAGGALAAAQVNNGYNQFATAVINNTDAFWVEAASTVTTGSGRQKADMWLYPRAGSVDTAFVECASCHDPHTSNPTFLRTPNDYSSVCLSCHIK
jgi:predicted CXXCH cytochrome family protein